MKNLHYQYFEDDTKKQLNRSILLSLSLLTDAKQKKNYCEAEKTWI